MTTHTALSVFWILSLCASQGMALYCYRCTYSKLESSNSIFDSILSIFRALSDDTCLLAETSDLYEIPLRECPPPDKAGYIYKCATIDGTVTAKFKLIFSLHYRTMERDCLQVPAYEEEYSDGCHTQLPASGPARDLMDKGFSGIDLGELHFDGQVCYQSQSVEVNGLLCPRCTFSEMEAGQGVVDTILNVFSKISNEDCQLLVPNSRYQIDYRNCRDPAPGHINKCGLIKGTVEARLGTDFRYKTMERDCVTGREGKEGFNNGCFKDLDPKGPGGALLQETFRGLDLGDVKFYGTACYQPNAEKLLTASAIISASTNLLLLTTLLILPFIL